MKAFLTLDKIGFGCAVVLGSAVFFLGKDMGLFFLGLLMFFLGLSVIVTDAGMQRKKAIGVYEASRGWRNVVANGAVPLLIAAFYSLNKVLALTSPTDIIIYYVASISALTADKFASEIGVLSDEPIMLLTLKRVKRGTSGAVTILGLIASLLAALLISFSILLVNLNSSLMWIVVISGFTGGVVDSLFGYLEDKGIGNKYSTNILGALGGVVMSALLIFVLKI